MIGRIQGILLEKHPPQIVVDVQGIGYELDVPMSTFYNLPATGSTVALFTQLVVREDAHLLYGFGTAEERQTFRLLLKVSGIGAKTALAILSGLSVSELAQTVAAQDASRLVKVPGIGRKTAERILLELKDKLAPVTKGGLAGVPQGPSADALNALLALGYNDKEANWALSGLPPELTVSDAIRQALKLLSKA
jgi:Holliday junction DNA helicase RuvA